MEFLFELLLELIAEGTVELSQSIRVPKFVRYLLIAIIIVFFIAVIGIMVIASITALQENLIFGIILVALTLFTLVMGILKFRKTYLTRKNK